MEHRSAAVASRAIELALRGKKFQVSDIQRGITDPPSRQTIYRVLQQLEEDEWITSQGNSWGPDLKTRMLSDVDEEPSQQKEGLRLSSEDILD